MRRTFPAVVMLIALWFATAFAANTNPTGTWNGEFKTREGGAFQVTLTLKADGDKLTGTLGIGNSDDMAIENGKVTGDQITFTITRAGRDNQKIQANYTGKIDGDSMKLTSSREGSQRTQEYTLTRAK